MFACQIVRMMLKLIINNGFAISNEAKYILNLIADIRSEKWWLVHFMTPVPLFPPANYTLACQSALRDFQTFAKKFPIQIQVVQLERTTDMFKTYDGMKLVDCIYSPYLILIKKYRIDEKPHKTFSKAIKQAKNNHIHGLKEEKIVTTYPHCILLSPTTLSKGNGVYYNSPDLSTLICSFCLFFCTLPKELKRYSDLDNDVGALFIKTLKSLATSMNIKPYSSTSKNS